LAQQGLCRGREVIRASRFAVWLRLLLVLLFTAGGRREGAKLFALRASRSAKREVRSPCSRKTPGRFQDKPADAIMAAADIQLRFDVGAMVMCNLGRDGWRLGRVIALHYREDTWPIGQVAPYQVALEGDHSLIYVPHEEPRYCRAATPEDLNVERRLDALAPPPSGPDGRDEGVEETAMGDSLLTTMPQGDGVSGYRDGRCHGCDCCPGCWSAVELYSEHYRAAVRNGLKITRLVADLGVVQVGASVCHPANDHAASGFMQCPTLPRLPPGLTLSDSGALRGEVRFDPH